MVKMKKEVFRMELDKRIQKGITVYYAQIMPPPLGTYNVLDLKIHTVKRGSDNDYFTGCDIRGNKHTYLFTPHDIDKHIFFDRNDALTLVKAAEEKYKDVKINNEVNYEEY